MQRIWGKHLQVETTANIIGAHSREPVAQQGGKIKPVCTAWHRKGPSGKVRDLRINSAGPCRLWVGVLNVP